jgi:AraC-like DNA-binding protein
MGDINNNMRRINIIGPETTQKLISPAACPPLAFYNIYLAGLSDIKGEFRFVRPDPFVSQVLVGIAGYGMVRVEDKWVKCLPGTAYITPPHVFHAYHSLADQPWEIAWVMYMGNSPGNNPAYPARPILIDFEPQPLVQAIQWLHHEATVTTEPAILHHWSGLVAAYSQRAFEPADSKIDERLRLLGKTINDNLAHPWDIQQLARLVNVTPEHLRRLCRQYLGRSPMRYVTYLRMRYAAMLLLSESYSIETIAHKVGYENSFAFSTAFKRFMKEAPSEYRKKVIASSLNQDEIIYLAN